MPRDNQTQAGYLGISEFGMGTEFGRIGCFFWN